MSKKLLWTIISFITLILSIIFIFLYFNVQKNINENCNQVEARVISVIWEEDIEVEYIYQEELKTTKLGYFSDDIELTDTVKICLGAKGELKEELKSIEKSTPKNLYGLITIISLIIFIPSIIKTIKLFRKRKK